jgi:hypothetical protein
MAMKTLEYLRGISAEDCRRLRARGIRHTNQLLHATTLEIDRDRLSARTGISEDRLLEFGRQCAMLEISGLEPYLPIVRRMGITGLKQLKPVTQLSSGGARECQSENCGGVGNAAKSQTGHRSADRVRKYIREAP